MHGLRIPVRSSLSLSLHLFICPFVYRLACPSVPPSVRPSRCCPVHPEIRLSSYLAMSKHSEKWKFASQNRSFRLETTS